MLQILGRTSNLLGRRLQRAIRSPGYGRVRLGDFSDIVVTDPAESACFSGICETGCGQNRGNRRHPLGDTGAVDGRPLYWTRAFPNMVKLAVAMPSRAEQEEIFREVVERGSGG